MKKYYDWAKICENIGTHEKAYEEAKNNVNVLNEEQAMELMKVARFISSKTFYAIASNIVAIIAIALSPVESISVGFVFIMILLVIILILVIKGQLSNKAMERGANYVLWAIYDSKNEWEGKAS